MEPHTVRPRQVSTRVVDLVGTLDGEERYTLNRCENAEVISHAHRETADAEQDHHLLRRPVLVRKDRGRSGCRMWRLVNSLAALSNEASSPISLQKKRCAR